MLANHRVRAFSSSRRSSKLRRFAALAALAASIGCDSTSPGPNITGVWEAHVDFLPRNDTLVVVLTQDGSWVSGFALLHAQDYSYDDSYFLGSVSGRTVDLKTTYASHSARLSGVLAGDQFEGVFDFGFEDPEAPKPQPVNTGIPGNKKYSLTLRRVRPASADVAGTWVLSATSRPDATVDTIVVAPDGRAWEHRALGNGGFASPAMWKRNGNWLVLRYYPQFRTYRVDSLRVTSSELQRPYGFLGGVEHFTRISTAAVLP